MINAAQAFGCAVAPNPLMLSNPFRELEDLLCGTLHEADFALLLVLSQKTLHEEPPNVEKVFIELANDTVAKMWRQGIFSYFKIILNYKYFEKEFALVALKTWQEQRFSSCLKRLKLLDFIGISAKEIPKIILDCEKKALLELTSLYPQCVAENTVKDFYLELRKSLARSILYKYFAVFIILAFAVGVLLFKLHGDLHDHSFANLLVGWGKFVMEIIKNP